MFFGAGGSGRVSRRGLRCAPVVVLLVLLAGGGCKTQDDAVAAASQLSSTAKTMSDYYTALDQVLANTEGAYLAQYAINNAPPLALSDERAQIRSRSEMAAEVGQLAAVFQKLAGSTAAADAAGAADKLNTELVSVTGLHKNDDETAALKLAVKGIVELIQQHKEVEAARKMAPFTAALSKFFDSETVEYNSINRVYLDTASDVAKALVKRKQVQVDVESDYVAVLKPFGLSPAIDMAELRNGSPVIRAKMIDLQNAQIDSRHKTAEEAATKATAALSEALKEMDRRVETVAKDQPMKIVLPPLTLDTVNNWIASIGK